MHASRSTALITVARSLVFAVLALAMASMWWPSRFVPLLALQYYGTLEALFWTFRLALDPIARKCGRWPVLRVRRAFGTWARAFLLILLGLCLLPVSYAYIRWLQYLDMPMEKLFFDEYKRGFFDWMCNGDFAVDAVLPLVALQLLLLLFGFAEIIATVVRAGRAYLNATLPQSNGASLEIHD